MYINGPFELFRTFCGITPRETMMHLMSLVLFVTAVTQCATKECSEAPGTDGCSIPDWADSFVPYQGTFTPACYKHDVCYSCGVAKGVSRRVCDKRFLSNMKRRCDRWDIWCKNTAYSYYKAVRVLGGEDGHYNEVSPHWCKESWVSNCMK